MPQTLETDGLNIEFPDSFTLDQITDWTRNQLPNLRERIQKGVLPDLASRIPRDAAFASADTLMAAGRAWQAVKDAAEVQKIKLRGVADAMSAPIGNEHYAIGLANDQADQREKALDATREQRLETDNRLFKYGKESKQNAAEYYQTNPTLESSIPAAVSKTIPRLAEAAALEAVAAPVTAVVAPLLMATKIGRIVPAMLSAGTAFGIGDEGKFNPTEAAIAAGTVPAFGAGEAIASKILERLPIKNVNLDIPDVLKFSGTIDRAEEASALGRKIQGAPEGFSAQIEQKLTGIPIGETGRKLIEQTGGVLAANGYLLAVQMPGIMALPEEKRGAAIADFLASNAAMSLLGYLPLLGGEPSKARPEIIKRVGEKLKDELTQKYGEPPSSAAGLPEPPPSSGQPPAEPFVSPVQPSPDQAAAEEAAAMAEIQRRQGITPAPVVQPEIPPVTPAPAPVGPRRRSPATAPTPVTPVPEIVTRVTPPTAPISQPTQLGYTPPSLPGQPEAQPNAPVPETKQKGVVPAAQPVTYEDAQKRVESIEDRLAAQGVNIFHLYSPDSAKDLVGHEDWKPMPPELEQAYKVRDSIGANQLRESMSDLSSRLQGIGLTDKEASRVLENYGMHPGQLDAAAQSIAVEFGPKLASQDPNSQAADVAISLAIEREENIDELKHVSKNTLKDAARAVDVVREYFGVKPQTTGELNAIIAGKEKPITQREGTSGQVEVNGPNRNVAPVVQEAGNPPSGGNQLLSSQIKTPQAQGQVVSPPVKWYDQLQPAQKEALFVEMRAIQSAVDKFTEHERRLQLRPGTIAAGVGAFDPFIRRESLATLLRGLRNGLTPELAGEQAKAFAREAVTKHNQKRPRDINWIRDPGTAYSYIDDAVRRTLRSVSMGGQVRNAEKPAVPQTEIKTPKVARKITPAPEQTPLQRDWTKLKADTPDHLLAVRMGDFYEFFNSDAELVAKKTRVAMTKRANVSMAGIPFHAAETYFKALTDAGLKVAIVDVQNGQRVATEFREPTTVSQIQTPQAQVEAKTEQRVQEVAQVQGQRAAKEIKSELVQRLEQALKSAPSEATAFNTAIRRTGATPETRADLYEAQKKAILSGNQIEKITIEIPGDGMFTILRTKEAIEDVLKRARKIGTSAKEAPSVTKQNVTGEQAKQFAEEARMSPEEVAAFRAEQRPTEKLSVTLSEPTTATGVTRADIEQAFPSEQGFSVKQVALDWTGGQPSVGYLVQLPNGQIIVIDPTHEHIAFDPKKAAADWGFNEQELAKFGVARAKWTPGGVKIEGLDVAGIIDLLKTSGPDTLSHDKFHPLFQLAFTEPERQKILKRYGTEEKAAEAFRRSEGFTRGFWDKIKRFLEWLANLFRGDAFKKLRSKLSPTFRSEPTAGGEKLSLDLSSEKNLNEQLAKPFVDTEEATSLKRAAGAAAGLVPDTIANEVRSLNPADTVEERMAGLLDFVLQLHGMAPALELQRILADPQIRDDTKQSAISTVLRQIENVRVKANEFEEKLQEANKTLASAVKNGGKITAQRLVEGNSKQIADNLISRYRSYLTAQAANLPANQNLAAARTELINGMNAVLDQEQRLPDATSRAIRVIAERIDELPVNEGPQAVIDAIRQKDILRGKVGDDTIDLLTKEQAGLMPPLLLNPNVNAQLLALADLQKKAATYAKQIEVIEQAFRGKGELTPVELKKFAETYRKFRNKQTDAAKAIRDLDKQFKEASDDFQVYGRSHDILSRLQNDPQFKNQFETAIGRPGGHAYDLFADIEKADKQTGLITYVSPLVQTDAKGKEFQNKFHVSLAPNRSADAETISDMHELVDEIDRFLAQPNIDQIAARSWKNRRDYIVQNVLPAAYGMKQVGQQIETRYGIINLHPFHTIKTVLGGAAAAPRSELERMSFRAARDLNDDFLTTDLARNQLVRTGHNTVFGDEVTKVLVLNAVKSHKFPNDKKWGADKIGDWNVQILNPIIAAGQAPGQLRLVPGSYIPGTGLQITKEDYAAAMAQKRFSQSIVNITQGVGKKLPPALVQNPILIEDTFAGKKIRRSASSTGPLTMARRFSAPGLDISTMWFEKGSTDASRMAMIRDGTNFESSALSYVTTTNPEFNRQSSLNPVYETYTANAATDPAKRVTNYDQLVERLSEIAVAKKMFPSLDEARTAISPQLFSELGKAIAAYHNAVQSEIPAQTTETNPKALLDVASAANAFTRPRRAMLGPDAFYDYTLTEGNDRIGFTAGAYQLFQLRNVNGLNQFIATLKEIEKKLNFEVTTLKRNTGISHRKAVAVVQSRTEKELDERNMSFLRIQQAIRTLEKVEKSLSELVRDRRDKNDAFMLYAMSRFQSTLSSALLSAPTAIANNFAGGILTSNFILQQNLGRANLLLSQIGSTKHTVKVLANRFLRLVHADTPIGAFARSNIPLLNKMAKLVDEAMQDSIKMNAELEAWGLSARPDKKSLLAARSMLKATAGAIETGDISLLKSIPNYIETFPGLNQFLVHLRDLSPRAIDEAINEILSESYRRDIYDPLKKAAIAAFEARKSRGESNDFTQLANLLRPSELGMSGKTGYRDLENYRDLFHSMGSFDTFLQDYYRRWDAAPESEKADVPLFPSPEAEGQITFNLAAHSNIPTAGFTPPSMQGVGQRGLFKRVIFMFTNYVRRMAEQIEKTGDFDLRDPKLARRLKFFWQAFTLLIVFAVAGALSIEVGSPITRLLTGRSPAKLTLANVLSEPDAASISRYLGMTLANNFPYYGSPISQSLGNPGYGSLLDVANLIPMFGLIKDFAQTASKINQTKDALFPAVDFISRWFPPLAPLGRLLPGVEGDIEAKNAARALRVVGPSVGLELAPGGGAPSTQSPASASIRRLIAAAYQGDAAGVQAAFDQAVQEKRDQGNPTPEKAVLAAIASREPARTVFGRAITPEEEITVIGKMSSGQRSDYSKARNAFSLINQTLGTNYQLTSTPKARTRGQPGQATRRPLFGASESVFGRGASRLRILGRRRSPFGHLTIRGATQRKSKRRSPARFSLAA